MRFVVAAGLAALAPAASARAQDPLVATTDPADRTVMAEAAAAVAARPPDLPRLDAVLAKLPRPTPLRGMVQSVRAEALARTNRNGDALAALEESLRLLPDHPAPKLIGAHILTFAGAPQRGADLWMLASTAAPEMARRSDQYVMGALIGRLREMGDGARADRLEARMGEIGYATALAPARSSAALARVRLDVAAARTDEARSALTGVGDPRHLLELYLDRRYEALWPRIAEWSGPAFQPQLVRHLEDLRREWAAGDNPESAANYARVLAGLGEHKAVVTLFLPALERSDLGPATPGVEFLTPVVARSLASTGRETEARALVARVAALFPGDRTGRDLNFSGALITADLNQHRWGDVLTGSTAWLMKAEALGPSVNDASKLQVRSYRGCALWKTGRRTEAEPEMAAVLLGQAIMPAWALRVHMCRDDQAAARDLLIASLADESRRSWALGIVQPAVLATHNPLADADHAFLETLRRDPEVLAAVEKVGRVLPRPVMQTLPEGFDPFATERTRPPRPGEV